MFIHAYMYMHTYMQTYIHTYIPTYLHTYMLSRMYIRIVRGHVGVMRSNNVCFHNELIVLASHISLIRDIGS